VWINVLQTAGVEVEVCHVVEASTTEKGSLKGINKRTIEDERSSLPKKRRKTPKSYDYGELDGTDVDEEDDGGMEMEEWRYESGDEAASKAGKADGVLLTRAQAQALDNGPEDLSWSGSDFEAEQSNKENRLGTSFRKGTPLVQPQGSSKMKRVGPTKKGNSANIGSSARTQSGSAILCR
jgi:hypothetical protein